MGGAEDCARSGSVGLTGDVISMGPQGGNMGSRRAGFYWEQTAIHNHYIKSIDIGENL